MPSTRASRICQARLTFKFFIETDFLNEISVPSKLHEYGDILKGYELCCVGLWDFFNAPYEYHLHGMLRKP
ncbi:hypothetical protein EKN63_18895 [Enterobacter hormaechei]|nr:hypothetical protein EKN63_18895 [Enterobacter hormaechei]